MTKAATEARNNFLKLSREEQLELMQFFLGVLAGLPEEEGAIPDTEKEDKEAEKVNGHDKTFTAIRIDTRGFKFNREEANER